VYQVEATGVNAGEAVQGTGGQVPKAASRLHERKNAAERAV
jgi:hypothetical protein